MYFEPITEENLDGRVISAEKFLNSRITDNLQAAASPIPETPKILVLENHEIVNHSQFNLPEATGLENFKSENSIGSKLDSQILSQKTNISLQEIKELRDTNDSSLTNYSEFNNLKLSDSVILSRQNSNNPSNSVSRISSRNENLLPYQHHSSSPLAGVPINPNHHFCSARNTPTKLSHNFKLERRNSLDFVSDWFKFQAEKNVHKIKKYEQKIRRKLSDIELKTELMGAKTNEEEA